MPILTHLQHLNESAKPCLKPPIVTRNVTKNQHIVSKYVLLGQEEGPQWLLVAGGNTSKVEIVDLSGGDEDFSCVLGMRT